MTKGAFEQFVHEAVGRPVLAWRMRELRRFRSLLANPLLVQAARLRAHLDLIRGSAFARDFGLNNVKTIADLRSALPISGYERMAPYIERVRNGDFNALFGSHRDARVLMMALTSGTTAASKSIPVTVASLAEYRKSWTIWGTAIAETHPRIPFGGVLSLASGWRGKKTPGGLPEGSISGFLAASMHGTLRLTNAVPPSVAEIPGAEARWYTALRLALARSDLRMVTTANPSTLIALARQLDADRERLVADVANGTISCDLPLGVAKELRPLWRRRDRQRANFLAKIVDKFGRLTPASAWPELELVGVWTGGTLAPYLAMLDQYYGSVPRRDHGLSASEGRMTIPLRDGEDAGVLNIDGPFFEFIHEADYGRESAQTVLAHELAAGERYYLVVSTSGGLMRYDMADVVECRGHEGAAPRLAFLHKGAQVANLTGEKLSAHQAVDAAREVLRNGGRTTADAEFVLAPYFTDPPHYCFFVEDAAYRQILAQGPGFSAQLDSALCRRNLEYSDKRHSGRLGEVVLMQAMDGTFARLRESRMDRAGAALEQYKHPFLIADPAFAAGLIARKGTKRREGSPA